MIEGNVNFNGVPLVMLTVAGQVWPAVVDTGFNGDLELPEALRSAVNARFDGQVHSLLGGGQMIVEDTYIVDFPFDGDTMLAEATFVTGNEILIGTGLLQDYRLQIDFVAETLLLQRVA